jgi:hypothetical protein
MKIIRTSAGVVGALMVIGAFILTAQPGLLDSIPVLSAVAGLLTSVDPLLIFAFLVLVTGAYALLSFRPGSPEEETGLAFQKQPETPEDPEGELAFSLEDMDAEKERKEIRNVIEEALVNGKSMNEEEAQEWIEDGSWTDDRVAAGFVDSSLRYPIIERLREWLEEEGTEERRLRRTAKALEELEKEVST